MPDMSTIEINASFQSEQEAREAIHKLQALRVVDVNSQYENGRMMVKVDEDVANRAMRLIDQIGGSVT